jgi:chemotaxis protein histidine kinase CheA/CheY-like chemotaxis protein
VINKDKYIAKFVDEGIENITLVETLVFDYKEGVSAEEDLATILRALHTLKGTSRMLEFNKIETLSHSLESVFAALREQRIGLTENAIKLILESLDLLKTGFGAVQQTKNDEIDIEEHIKNLSSLAANEEFSLPACAKEKTKTAAPEKSAKADKAEVKQPKDVKSDSIRLSLEKIDGIIKNVSSLQTIEIAAKTISKNSAALNTLIKEYYKALKEDPRTDHGALENFRKLERQSERLNSSLKNYSIDTGNYIRGAYNTVVSLRTLPLSTIFDSYPRYVFQLSGELGKKVSFVINGKDNEIDKNIIESLSEVFLHMVRNSIDHGIEMPEERIAAGKSETGNLSITCSQESGNMKIIIADDGRGIDHEKIREKLLKEGTVSEIAAAAMTREDLTNYIFQSGFSTSPSISSVSGRGVGMDVVRGSIEALKGSIVVDSVPGKGTIFTIMVPLSIAALTGFPVVSSGINFIIPSSFVETVMLLNRDEIITVVDRPEIKYKDRIIKLYFLSQILKIKNELPQAGETVFVVIVHSYDDIAAIAVDNIDSMKAVILKKMPSFMETMPVFSGLVLNEEYEMVTVLHIPTVIKMAKRIKTIDMKKSEIEFEKLRKSILVVDDSRPTREIECEILQSEGYLVDTAPDGAQALKAAKAKHYDLICTDINMPIMDGFMLTENIKKNESLSNIPIIVISSMASEEDQNRAYSLGASRYIIKNSFNNHNLLEAVHDLIGAGNVR